MINEVLGQRYRITEKIGTGGMADVYKAVDETLGRSVAVKVMHARYSNDPSFTVRFRHEAQAAANLTSPNIVNIYDWGQDGNTYYIVMEYVRGTDLKTLIQQKTYLSTGQVIEIGIQVAKALDVAHGYDIIHRDIKPHNIMVTPDGQVKVMDFGIARAGNSNMTQTGSVLGTAHYVSPEQAQGKPLTPASDIYSLGIVLYEAACGKLPFDGDTPVAVAMKQVNEQPIRPSKFNPNIAPGLEAIIGKALLKDPRARYGSAKEIMDALRAIPANGAAVAPPAMNVPAGVAATTVIPAVEPAYPRTSRDQSNVPPVPGTQMNIPEEKSYWWAWILGILLLAGLGVGIYFMMQMGLAKPDVVPALKGKTLTEATAILNEAGYDVGEVSTEHSAEVAADLVISSDPGEGTELEKGSKVNLAISLGAEVKMATVPKVVGEPESNARALITAAGLVPDPQPAEYHDSVPSGQVISQDPLDGNQVPEGTKIAFVPSKGIETGGVPNVVGAKKADAEKTLKEAGFAVRVSEQFNGDVKEGDVIAQSPDAGASLNKGGTVTIIVSKGVEVAEVPPVIGMTEAAAKSALKNSGFKVEVDADFETGSGNVLDQSPAKGTKAAKGTTVTITVDLP